MKSINPYLNFDDRTEEAFNFYQSVFGGKISLMRYKEMPGAEKMPTKEKEKVMHATLPLGKAGMLMGSDVPGSMLDEFKFGTNTYIMIETESEKEAHNLYDKLSAEGKVEMELQKMFWGALYASFTDKFGVQWMINYTYEQKA